MFEALLYVSIFICLIGLVFQIWRFKRTSSFLKHPKASRLRSELMTIIPGFLNTLVQVRLFKAGKIRWLIHFGLFVGFLYLLLVHGLHDLTSDLFFDYYEPTIDPYQFLRNLNGVFVGLGCIAFLLRRRLKIRINKDTPLKYKGYFSIILILLVISSGFLLEASKIISEPVFMDMVEEYSDVDEESGLADLKLYWNHNFKVYFPQLPEVTSSSLENGSFLNEEYCLSCHSDTKSAFLSFQAAKLIYYAGDFLNRHRADSFLYAIHYILCLCLLACLPFSRLFHIILIPVAGLVKKQDSVLHGQKKAVVSAAGLYACTNCGYCSEVCSVYPHFQTTGNLFVLPHSKIESVKGLIGGDAGINPWLLQKGNEICTGCYNCTDICPSGIDLQTLWSVLGDTLCEEGYLSNSNVVNTIPLLEWAAKAPVSLKRKEKKPVSSGLADQSDAFEACVQCTICTNVCPVVEYDSVKNDYTPQQVMNLLRLGQRHVAEGTRMVHTCLTCYSCQEVCPQKIPVTDILLELRNSGYKKVETMKKDYLKGMRQIET